jgi:hypothetical protein
LPLPLSSLARPTILAALAATISLGGCRDAGLALGSSPEEARINAGALFGALGARFGPAETAPGYDQIRAQFARSALIPSRIYTDQGIWTASDAQGRVLELSGVPRPGTYLLGLRGAPTTLRNPGEYRRITRLNSLGGDEYQWRVRDELAVGPVSPDELGAALSALLGAADGTNAAVARAAYRNVLPRTTAALGRLFTLDSLALAPAPGGGTLVTLVSTMHPERIAGTFPHYARYLERYSSPASFDLVVYDESGMRWWVAAKDGDRLTLRMKVHDGHVAPLDGPPRRMPDRMRIRANMATRIRVFNIGANDLRGEVRLTRTSAEKGFAVRFRREPEWRLPLLVERMIRTPLRRPFDGDGALYGFSIRRAHGQTLLVRDFDVTVQESAILRWFGGLGSTAMSDFREGAEREYDRFNGEVFAALRADAAALLR